jgi:hypothetical protein
MVADGDRVGDFLFLWTAPLFVPDVPTSGGAKRYGPLIVCIMHVTMDIFLFFFFTGTKKLLVTMENVVVVVVVSCAVVAARISIRYFVDYPRNGSDS